MGQNLTSRYTWDDADNQTTHTTAVGHTTTATYNAAGDTTNFSDAYGTTRFAYDRLGRPTETTDATGRMSRTTYDSMDNVTAIVDYGKGATPLRSWAATFDLPHRTSDLGRFRRGRAIAAGTVRRTTC